MKQILIEDQGALGSAALWKERYETDEATLRRMMAEHDSARDLAARLEQELAEVQRRCMALASDWMASGSTYHAAQLAEALDLGAGETE